MTPFYSNWLLFRMCPHSAYTSVKRNTETFQCPMFSYALNAFWPPAVADQERKHPINPLGTPAVPVSLDIDNKRLLKRLNDLHRVSATPVCFPARPPSLRGDETLMPRCSVMFYASALSLGVCVVVAAAAMSRRLRARSRRFCKDVIKLCVGVGLQHLDRSELRLWCSGVHLRWRNHSLKT